jgi:hypothetical protein
MEKQAAYHRQHNGWRKVEKVEYNKHIEPIQMDLWIADCRCKGEYS